MWRRLPQELQQLQYTQSVPLLLPWHSHLLRLLPAPLLYALALALGSLPNKPPGKGR